MQLTFNRLRATVEVRTARALGGHLPSAARINTPDVLNRNYLRGDPSIRDWEDGVLTEALTDAEMRVCGYTATVLPGCTMSTVDAEAEKGGCGRGHHPPCRAGELDNVLARWPSALRIRKIRPPWAWPYRACARSASSAMFGPAARAQRRDSQFGQQ
ncbi:hypothetical protein [Allokutzneria oryzae]|uniref:Uncharacterized protein n=1 Tax=Allokutzneria oryzae TaxID=1378989 RepID=A0ABV5ZTM2_9PSEU